MKSTALILLTVTTGILVLLAVFSSLGLPYPLLFFLMCTGQLLLILTVYKVLTDKYTTSRSFKDFYQDHDID